MHKYVTRQSVLFAHRVQVLSGVETNLKNAEEDTEPQQGCRLARRGIERRMLWGFVPFVCSEQLRRKNRKASHDRAHSERRAAQQGLSG
ncbi:hypothetical protein ASY01nite_02200 [Acetobacter syzygii]|nr:hypothetical protein Absy_014_148 [Acetobacter syzygii]GBR63445.1 hypothetical protein AA0483_0875 [Acetobacter syzygii NRIC 0483]GEL55154.1 hypothetical protein ASY01nite_02200 [Acetobacter syzygii]